MADTPTPLPVPTKLLRTPAPNGLTDSDFGKTLLGIINQVSFPGAIVDQVIELKSICALMESGGLVLCVNSGS